MKSCSPPSLIGVQQWCHLSLYSQLSSVIIVNCNYEPYDQYFIGHPYQSIQSLSENRPTAGRWVVHLRYSAKCYITFIAFYFPSLSANPRQLAAQCNFKWAHDLSVCGKDWSAMIIYQIAVFIKRISSSIILYNLGLNKAFVFCLLDFHAIAELGL